MTNKKTILGYIIGAILLAIVVTRIDFRMLSTVFLEIHLGIFVLFIGIRISAVLVKGGRWYLLLHSVLEDPPKKAFSSLFLGYFGNVIFPAKLGEVVKIQVIRQHNRITFSKTLSTVVLERIFDMSILLVFFIVATFQVTIPKWLYHSFIVVISITGGLITFLVFLSLSHGRIASYITNKTDNKLLQKLAELLTQFSSGLKVVKDVRMVSIVIGLTLVAWFVDTLGLHLFFNALNIHIPFFATVLIIVVANIGIAIPSPPAGIGTYQFIYMVCLGWFHIPSTNAVGASITVTAVMIVLFTVFGLTVLWREGLSMKLFLPKKTKPESQVDTSAS